MRIIILLLTFTICLLIDPACENSMQCNEVNAMTDSQKKKIDSLTNVVIDYKPTNQDVISADFYE